MVWLSLGHGGAGNVPQLSANLRKMGIAVHLQAPVLSTVRPLGETNRTREIGKLGQTPVSQGSCTMWWCFCSPFAKLVSIYLYLVIAALVRDKFIDTYSNKR